MKLTIFPTYNPYEIWWTTCYHCQFKTRWRPLTPENELTLVADYKRFINRKHQICHCLGRDVLKYKTFLS